MRNGGHSEFVALVYTRVSSHKQTVQGHGLKSQEARCREFASSKGYEVVRVFADDISGSALVRPGMTELLAFARSNKKTKFVVIIDDISRLARGLEAHLAMRGALQAAGVLLESPSVSFGDDSDAVLVENLLASVSQHHRQKNSEQTHNRMRGRLLNGFWPFRAPTGYRSVAQKGTGKVLIVDPVEGPAIQEALTAFACGRLRSVAEATRFLNRHPVFERSKGVRFREHNVKSILRNFLYAGLVGRDEWEVSLRQGNHEPLISIKTYEDIQERLDAGSHGSVRSDATEDFVLRGFVACSGCGGLLTACWSTSKTGRKYPYYYCVRKGCVRRSKSIRRCELDSTFEELLGTLVPDPAVVDLAERMFSDVWDDRRRRLSAVHGELKRRLGTLDQRIERYLNQIVEAENKSVIAAYERKISELEREKLRTEDKMKRYAAPKHTFESAFELSMNMLRNPLKIWRRGDHAARLSVLRLTFAGPLVFDPDEGFRTHEISMPYKALGEIGGSASKMAARRGIEPLFPG